MSTSTSCQPCVLEIFGPGYRAYHLSALNDVLFEHDIPLRKVGTDPGAAGSGLSTTSVKMDDITAAFASLLSDARSRTTDGAGTVHPLVIVNVDGAYPSTNVGSAVPQHWLKLLSDEDRAATEWTGKYDTHVKALWEALSQVYPADEAEAPITVLLNSCYADSDAALVATSLGEAATVLMPGGKGTVPDPSVHRIMEYLATSLQDSKESFVAQLKAREMLKTCLASGFGRTQPWPCVVGPAGVQGGAVLQKMLRDMCSRSTKVSREDLAELGNRFGGVMDGDDFAEATALLQAGNTEEAGPNNQMRVLALALHLQDLRSEVENTA